ncbi:MAG: glutamine synthetase III [Kiritimatiellae bacterium]|nr:glutamine synthetase III [Kiritimatiellia bacterium]
MSNKSRAKAVADVAEIRPPLSAKPAPAGFEDFGSDVFAGAVLRDFLTPSTCESLEATVKSGAPLDPAIANDVAAAMKSWALSRGATHYTHWFLPLTGSTAEKHDAFLETDNDHAISAFSGKNLVLGEPDASSFPSGGIRSTFEARGYTAWDPTSPAFIKRHGNGATLCIPTAFCAYTGEALDKKTPLLRSVQALSAATRRLMRCFGLPGDEKVTVTMGPEQEYFLIDRHFYVLRPDLLQTGRTVYGAPPAKHQQLEDHYFGTIKARVLNFMTEVERELWRLGIPAKTRHNEVAPAQFELAPIYEDLNLACDHNMLVMEVLRQAAERNGLVCLLHEKPFAGVNGSGKHNNWSVCYGKTNLLNPGKDPRENAIFLTVLAGIIRAIDAHADLLRATVAGAGNDHRLGANEAPPAVISIYVGDQLAQVIDQLVSGEGGDTPRAGVMRIGVDTLPPLPRDATDRNRTSPFAFTGNKFEFRAPGSSQNCAGPNTVLNTIIADSFDYLASALEPAVGTPDFPAALQALLQKEIKAHRRIIFNGDGYNAEWLAEAARRGLPNAATTMDALAAIKGPENIALFEKYHVYSGRELASRYEVASEEYHTRIRIEGEIALELARTMVEPATRREYLKAVAAPTDGDPGAVAIRDYAATIGDHLAALHAKAAALETALQGKHEEILAAMADIRQTVDALERLLPDWAWPLPKYREMLFIY